MESLNPFDDENAVCCVLINGEQQYSLWPQNLTIPAGWCVAFGPMARSDCNHWLEDNWRDMRPHALRLHDAVSSEQEQAGV